MADELLNQRHSDENRRLHSAFLAGAPAAIAFAFHQTSDRDLSWPLLPILLAVLAWGGSFAAGVWASRHLQLALKANISRNVARRDGNPQTFDLAERAFETARDKSWTFQEMQLWLLFAGAAFYLVGHIWHLTQ